MEPEVTYRTNLRETRVSAGDAAVYVTPNDVREYAEAIVALMDGESARARMAKLGRARVEQELAWSRQRRAYYGVYYDLIAARQAGSCDGGHHQRHHRSGRQPRLRSAGASVSALSPARLVRAQGHQDVASRDDLAGT